MPSPLEHVPTVDRVNAYLAPRAQGDVCREVTECAPWPAEAFLMDDLARHLRQERPLPVADRATTRLYLRAVSWFRYPAPSDRDLFASVDTLPALAAPDRALFHTALAGHHDAEALEPAARRIDALYLEAWDDLRKARKQAELAWQDLERSELPAAVAAAKARIEALRPVRDALYFRRHLPHWLSWTEGTGK